MAIFNKDNERPASASETTIIAGGAKVEGVFNCNSRLHIDGKITGTINSKSIVTIGKSGKVNGEIIASRLIINGVFEGEANCDTIEVLAGGKLLGKVVSKELIIEAKAEFEGESKIKKDDVTATIKDATKAK